MFYSADSHYSVPKAGRLYRIPTVEVASLKSGEMDYADLGPSWASTGGTSRSSCR